MGSVGGPGGRGGGPAHHRGRGAGSGGRGPGHHPRHRGPAVGGGGGAGRLGGAGGPPAPHCAHPHLSLPRARQAGGAALRAGRPLPLGKNLFSSLFLVPISLVPNFSSPIKFLFPCLITRYRKFIIPKTVLSLLQPSHEGNTLNLQIARLFAHLTKACGWHYTFYLN